MNDYAGPREGGYRQEGYSRDTGYPREGGYPRKEGGYGGGFPRKEGGNRFVPKPVEPTHGVIYQPYAVTGNKDIAGEWLEWAKTMAPELDRRGFTLRTGGGGQPLEEAFESAAEHKEIHLPWKDFNQKESNYTRTHKDAEALIRRAQPNYESLKPAVQAILNRNAAVVFGKDLRSPIRFMITYTDDGVEMGKDRTSQTGFAGLPIVLAGWLHIPVFNLKNADAAARLQRYIDACTLQA